MIQSAARLHKLHVTLHDRAGCQSTDLLCVEAVTSSWLMHTCGLMQLRKVDLPVLHCKADITTGKDACKAHKELTCTS